MQEIEALLEHLNIELRKTRAKHYKKFLEAYQRALTSRDAEKYIDGEDEVVVMSQLINEFALVRNKYLGLLKAIDAKQFQINNIVKLRVAGLDDAELYSKNSKIKQHNMVGKIMKMIPWSKCVDSLLAKEDLIQHLKRTLADEVKEKYSLYKRVKELNEEIYKLKKK